MAGGADRCVLAFVAFCILVFHELLKDQAAEDLRGTLRRQFTISPKQQKRIEALGWKSALSRLVERWGLPATSRLETAAVIGKFKRAVYEFIRADAKSYISLRVK